MFGIRNPEQWLSHRKITHDLGGLGIRRESTPQGDKPRFVIGKACKQKARLPVGKIVALRLESAS